MTEEGAKPADGAIEKRTNIWFAVMLPVIVLIVVLAGILTLDASGLGNCDRYWTIQLIYPLIFGALGAVLGGNVRLSGPVAVLGTSWNGAITGGIGAAVLGVFITSFVQPSKCTPGHELVLQNISTAKRINTVEGGKELEHDYITTFNWSESNLQIVAESSKIGSRDLRLFFNGQNSFEFAIDFYRKGEANAQFQRVATCSLIVKFQEPPAGKDYRRFQLVKNNSRFELNFSDGFFAALEAEMKTGLNNKPRACFASRSKEAGKELEDTPVIQGDLYMTGTGGWSAKTIKTPEIWFIAAAATAPGEKETARTSEDTESKPPQTTSPVAPTVAPPPAVPQEITLPQKRVVPGCNPPEALRDDIDRYIAGDDLDAGKRTALYAGWKELHCYVWALVRRPDGQVNLTEKARALRLTVSAIVNEPPSSGQPAYWQPQGDNKRDFSKDLPYLTASDYKIIFDIAQADDVILRTEAIRAIRSVPVDRFEVLFRSARDSIASYSSNQQERLAIAAAFLYYNRIVEWLDDDPVMKPSTAAVAAEFNSGRKWIARNFLGKSTNSYDAMLLYAKGIVERERKLTADEGFSTFVAMTKDIEALEDPYPSSARHLAQALAIARGGSDARTILGQIKQVDIYPVATPLSPDLQIVDQPLIYAGPGDQFAKQSGVAINKSATQVLMKKGDWYFANGQGWFGWIKRSVKV